MSVITFDPDPPNLNFRLYYFCNNCKCDNEVFKFPVESRACNKTKQQECYGLESQPTINCRAFKPWIRRSIYPKEYLEKFTKNRFNSHLRGLNFEAKYCDCCKIEDLARWCACCRKKGQLNGFCLKCKEIVDQVIGQLPLLVRELIISYITESKPFIQPKRKFPPSPWDPQSKKTKEYSPIIFSPEREGHEKMYMPV